MRVAVVGASGVVGRSAMTQLQMSGIEAVAISRRQPDLPHIEFIGLDLLDSIACCEIASRLADVTHVIFAALYEKPGLIEGWRDADQMQTNLAMLDNFVSSALAEATQLQHVALLQGTKAYGAHIQPMKIPGREREPRVKHDNFYWLQEDYIRAHQATADWHYSIWRPQIVVGHGLSAPMNMLAAIGAYAAFCRFDGVAFSYPGGPNSPIEAVDADLLSRAIIFGLESETAKNETFNVTNGDVFEWRRMWPGIAAAFGLEVGCDQSMPLASLYDREDDWQKLISQYGLQPCTLREFVGDSFFYADALFSTAAARPPPPALVSTIKLRQAGFSECIDTEDMFAQWFRRLVMMNRLPGGQA
ncbi:MAG: nucleoside-diphosphate-sugar epimerase [Candidatus Azotimanducaceae bacterium]|jgi:nucleoside-diphosphate-sugar epimerase